MPQDNPTEGPPLSIPGEERPVEVAFNASLPLPAHDATATSSSGHSSSPKIWRVGTLTYTSGALIALFFWLLLCDLAWSMRDRSVLSMAQWYLSQLTVSNVLFGLLMTSFPALIGLVLSPVISVKSDRHRGKWGRRIPFLLVTTPIAAFGMIGLAVTPLVSKWVHLQFPQQNELMVSVVCFGIFWAAFEFATIASQSVFGGLVNDVVPASLMGRFYGLFRAVSLIVGMIFNYWIYGKIADHFTLILIVIGIFYGAAFMWACLNVREGEYPPPPPPEPRKPNPLGSFLSETRRYFKECFSSPYYISVFIMFVTAGLVFLPVNTFGIPFANSLGVAEDLFGKSLTLTFGISLSIAYFLGWLCDKFHPLRMTMASVAGYLLVTLYGSLYATTPKTFLIAWVLHGVLSGCFYTCSASLGQRLFPHSRFAQFASAAGIVGSVATMAIGPAMGITIDATGNIYRYTFVMGGVLAVGSLIAFWMVYKQFVRLGGPNAYVAPE